MTNKLKLPAESRMQGDLQVRFGGRSGKTYRRKAERRPVVPSLHETVILIGQHVNTYLLSCK